MEIADYIIAGSGCTGAMAAETLCVPGKKVFMIDAGVQPEYSDNTAHLSYPGIRNDSDDQYTLFLGRHYEALVEDIHPNMPQQTPQRRFITALTDKLLPVSSANFYPVESLAFGGLGNAWGLGSYVFSEAELRLTGLPVNRMRMAYKTVAGRIGISCSSSDDASVYSHDHVLPLQPALELNEAAASLYDRYRCKKKYFQKKHLFMGRPPLALLTEAKDGRSPYNYADLDFYTSSDSAYRPQHTVQQLALTGKLQYFAGWLVLGFLEKEGFTEVECLHINTQERRSFYCKKLVLSTGTLSTARIVLRSMRSQAKLPVLCNAYTYMPMIYYPLLGKANTGKLSGLAQLAMYYDKLGDHSHVAMASVYNYRSLMHFRILQHMPVGYKNGLELLQLMSPALFIAGLFHPASYQPRNYVQLRRSATITGDELETNYTYDDNEATEIKITTRLYAKAFRKLRCLVLKSMNTKTGASIHYAGTLPFSDDDSMFSLNGDGRLHGTKNIFIADGSGFRFLPGKGVTLSLMANAHLVAENVLRDE